MEFSHRVNDIFCIIGICTEAAHCNPDDQDRKKLDSEFELREYLAVSKINICEEEGIYNERWW